MKGLHKMNNLRPDPPESGDEDSVWLLSYSDLMTLLFTFFVMMYALNLQEDGAILRRSIANYLQGGTEVKNPNLSEIQDQLIEKLESEKLLKDTKVVMTQNNLDLTFSASLMFDSGSAELNPESLGTMKKIAKVLHEKGKDLKIQIEGHTDDTPISTSKYSSNWELSGARAAHIAELFAAAGVPEKNLMAIGYGASRPLSANRLPSGEKDAEGQKLNRRVVVSLFLPQKD